MQSKIGFVFIILFASIHRSIYSIPVEQDQVFSYDNNNGRKVIRQVSNAPACISSNDCPAYSHCFNSTCQCVEGSITWKNSSFCAYRQKSKWIAFFLSFFLGIFGADWFYLAGTSGAYITAGVFKLLIIGCCGNTAYQKSKRSGEDENSNLCIGCIALLISIGSFAWWLTDWIRILTGKFSDSNGASLYTYE